MKEDLYAKFRDAREVTILKIEVNEGEGVDGDPVRRVSYLVTKQGKVLAKLGEKLERQFSGNDEMFPL